MRHCIFCSAQASSREHVWPSWLVARFSDAAARTYFERRQVPVGDWASPELKVKAVCKVCNNGWMSKMEQRTQPTIERLLDTPLTQIDTSEQVALAAWAVKTSMVFEAVGAANRPWIYSRHDREKMRTAHAIPLRTEVWIAKSVDHPGVYSAAIDLKTSESTGVRAFVITMAFGSLALQVLTIKTPPSVPGETRVTYDVSDARWDDTLVQLWPVSPHALPWPPMLGLAGELGLDALTERLGSSTRLH